MHTSIDPAEFRQVLGSFLTGVTVVTTAEEDGTLRGITANSFTSVSLDPPLVLFCVGKQSSSCDAFVASQGFNIHILSADQQGLARQFVRGTPAEKFAGIEVSATETGAPLITEAGAWLACRTDQVIDAGDHFILIGEVYSCEAKDYRPLGFFQSQFQTLNMGEEIAKYSARSSAPVVAAWILADEDGRVLLQRDGAGNLEIPKVVAGATLLREGNLERMAQEHVGASAGIDFLFSLYETEDERLVLIYRGALESGGTLAEGMEFVDLRDLPALEIADRVERSILTRYQRERVDARFGIYSGSHVSGSLARVDAVERR